MLFARLYVRLGILLIFEKHLHDGTISLRGEVWAHKTSLICSLFIEVPVYVPIQENKRSSICVLGVMYLCVRGHVFVC